MINTNKKYTNRDWLKKKILAGMPAREIAKKCNTSISAISRYYSKVINSLTMKEITIIITKHYDINNIISPRSEAYDKIKLATNYLPLSTNIKQRFWHIKHNSSNAPKCKMCNNNVNWNKDIQNYRTYCSIYCQGKDDAIIKKREKTNLSTFGTKYWNQAHIPPKSLKLLNDKKWLYEQHKVKKKSLMKIGNELGVHPLLPAQYLNRYGISGEQTSSAQTELCEFIREIYLDEIIENSKKIIPPLGIDIFLPDIKIAIEYNGIYWHSELAGRDGKYHLNKTNKCNEKNIKLIHIFENEWLNNKKIVKSRLRYILNKVKNITYARKCKIVTVSSKDSKKFLNKNHIQGQCNSNINFGLTYKGEIVSLMTLSRARFSKKYEYELVRYCNKLNSTTVGGASKLFKHFIKKYNPSSIVSYSDKRWNSGGLYEQLNFNYSHDSKPNYWYFQNNSLILHSRIKFQKHKLNNLLDNFDPNLTEWDNMRNSKYNRIWDCGNSVWIWGH